MGKRECSLDLETEKDCAQLHKLLEEADVVIQGYRKGSLERKGFGLTDVLEMASRRGKGVIYIDEVSFLHPASPSLPCLIQISRTASVLTASMPRFLDGNKSQTPPLEAVT